MVDTLLIDHEAVYDPRAGNDRLLLGLKGSLNEYELDLLRQRAVEARRAKALGPQSAVQRVPKAPAQAGRILAATTPTPLDLPSTSFVTGNAPLSAGGATAAAGTSKTAVDPRALHAPAEAAPAVARRTGRDLSVPAAIEENSWDCAWPAEADSAAIDEQAVLITISVRADGTAEWARPVGDPGHGFASAARRCALAHRYRPARDAEGRAVPSLLGPLSVHFTR